jgi:hypothetical protein
MSEHFDPFHLCYFILEISDQLFSEFNYESALEAYKQALNCFENSMDYTQPPQTNEFIREIHNKIKVVERLIRSKSKRKLREDYKLEDLKKYTEQEWEDLSLFDIIMISDIYNVPISQNESNIENMKYKFYIDFTEKYNPELKNLDQIEMIGMIMIQEGKYDQILSLLNVSPKLNKMIEDEVLNKVSSISLKRIKKFTDHLSDDVIVSINYCSWILKLTTKQKQQIKQNLFQLFTKELEKLEFVLYKNSFYKFTNDNVPLKIEDIKKIIRSLNVYLREVIEGGKNISGIKNDQECIYGLLSAQKKTKNFFNRTLENIDRMLNKNQNYISLLITNQ